MNERAALDRHPTEADRIGFFGKLPTHGDFVSTGLAHGFQNELDIWLQTSLQATQQHLGRDWERCFRAMPAWRFIIERGLWGPATIAGVMVPSLDRVGRSFPLIVAAQLHGFADHPRRLYLDDTWFTAAEAIAETSAKRDFDIGQFTTSLKRLRTLRPADLAEDEARPQNLSAHTTLWWRIDPETRQAKGFRTPGAPQTGDFMKLVGDGSRAHSIPPKTGPAEKPRPVKPAPTAFAIAQRPLNFLFEHSYATHPGTRLTLNADSLLVCEKPRLFAVVDGVGHDNGAVEAGRIAVQVLSETAGQKTIEALVQDIKGKLGRAHGILQSRQLSSGREPSSASIVVFAALHEHFALLWAGDARCYLVRDGMMRCLTRDHVAIGLRHTLSRSVGARGQLVPEVLSGRLQPGDRFLLCSAPLPRVLPERGIAEILISPDAAKAADILVQEGLIANCRENISAIVVTVKTDDA
ncbi:type VI secretion system-associated protein TagF [Neorhizobium sp. DT-125]|uniref:type VI secretion system-associated protein TagF n=1 Tax=Neorhizobium sp. DT-125 TaxID=3396163 RepID=UPI003F1BFD1D